MSYLRPTSARISDSWQGHKNRRPPSQEPGTDYACAYGTTLVAPANGRIVSVQTSTAGATGRFLTIDLDDGRRIRWLHLSAILVGNGARVSRGQSIARSGASAWGSEWGVGAHVHVSLFPSHSYGGFGPNSTLDFEKYIGGSNPPAPSKPKPKPTSESEEDEMKNCGVYYERSKNTWVYLIFNSGSGWYHEFSNGANAGRMPSDYNNALAVALDTRTWAKVTPGHARVIKAGLDAVRRTAVTGSLSVDIEDDK